MGLLAAIVLLAAVTACSLAYGAKAMPLQTVWDAFTEFDPQNNDHLIVRSLRVPRTIVGLLVGAALGLAGAVMQGVTRNPLADPALLGIEAGASLAVVAGISVFNIGSLSGYVWFAFVGAAAASAVVYGLSSFGHRGSTPLKLALAGTAVAALLSSLTSAVLLLDVTTLDQFRFWVVGSLAGRDDAIIWDVIPFIAVGAVLSAGVGSGLNTLALGDDIARGLGQRVAVIRAVSAVAVVLLCGAATAAAGPIAFVGLTVPHVARAICGPDYRWILPWSMVLAPTLLLGADVIGRLVARPGELQVGIVTAIIGAPFFIALVRRRHLVEL
ncbi:MAG TPA: iron chelate uptake ABC transporter family permease subunit [Desertimonas sp.]|nr:iron chelate uptake ABC transporter family permease subunit [Desertimonas sp.]